MDGWITFDESTDERRYPMPNLPFTGQRIGDKFDRVLLGRSVSQPYSRIFNGQSTVYGLRAAASVSRSDWVSFDGPLTDTDYPFFVPKSSEDCLYSRQNSEIAASRFEGSRYEDPGDGRTGRWEAESSNNYAKYFKLSTAQAISESPRRRQEEGGIMVEDHSGDGSEFTRSARNDTRGETIDPLGNRLSDVSGDSGPLDFDATTPDSSHESDSCFCQINASLSDDVIEKVGNRDDNANYERMDGDYAPAGEDSDVDSLGSVEKGGSRAAVASTSYDESVPQSETDDDLPSANGHDVANSPEGELDDYPLEKKKADWAMLYRYPHRKLRLGSREWLPVSVTIQGSTLRLFGLMNNTEVVKEFPLHPFFVFSVPRLHKNDHDSKVHCVSLQYVKYKETRKMQLHGQVDHTPVYTPVLKIANSDYKVLNEFTEAVENVIRKIPTHRDKGIVYRHEEVFIDCDDVCRFQLAGDGRTLKHNITTIIRLRAFITGTPDVTVYLNDIATRGIQDMTLADDRSRRTSKPLKWIAPLRVERHPCVNLHASKCKGGVVLHPPDGCSFELMRFRARNSKPLPLLATSCLEIISSHLVELRADVQMCSDASLKTQRRNDVTLRFPIPNSWTPMFVKSRRLDGRVKYVTAAADPRTMVTQIGRNSRCTIEVTIGSASYDPAYSALVWRLGTLPFVGTGQPVDFLQKFKCRIEVPFEIHAPEGFRPFSELEFKMSHTLGSDVTVREVLLSDGRTPDKWVCYRSRYNYKILMKLIDHGREILRSDVTNGS